MAGFWLVAVTSSATHTVGLRPRPQLLNLRCARHPLSIQGHGNGSLELSRLGSFALRFSIRPCEHSDRIRLLARIDAFAFAARLVNRDHADGRLSLFLDLFFVLA